MNGSMSGKAAAHTVIGANSVVLQDIPDDSVAAGAPARVVKARGVVPATEHAWKESQC